MPNDTNAYPEDSFDNMKAFAGQHGLTFPYAIDTTQEVARAYDAQCTPDFFGFNPQDELEYRGRLDASRMTPVPNARRDLFEAMKQIAEIGHGPKEQLASMGCFDQVEALRLLVGSFFRRHRKWRLKSSRQHLLLQRSKNTATTKGFPTARRQTSLHRKLQMIV